MFDTPDLNHPKAVLPVVTIRNKSVTMTPNYEMAKGMECSGRMDQNISSNMLLRKYRTPMQGECNGYTRNITQISVMALLYNN